MAVEELDMENGDQLVGMEVVEEIEMGSGNLVRSIEVVEVDMVERLTNQLQGGVRHGAKDGAAGYINQDTLHQNVSSESAFESDFYRTAVISLSYVLSHHPFLHFSC